MIMRDSYEFAPYSQKTVELTVLKSQDGNLEKLTQEELQVFNFSRRAYAVGQALRTEICKGTVIHMPAKTLVDICVDAFISGFVSRPPDTDLSTIEEDVDQSYPDLDIDQSY